MTDATELILTAPGLDEPLRAVLQQGVFASAL
jgi:hypothetical protein